MCLGDTDCGDICPSDICPASITTKLHNLLLKNIKFSLRDICPGQKPIFDLNNFKPHFFFEQIFLLAFFQLKESLNSVGRVACARLRQWPWSYHSRGQSSLLDAGFTPKMHNLVGPPRLGTVHKCRLCVEVPSTSSKRVDCGLILYVGGGQGVTNRSNFKKCGIFLEPHQIQSIVYTVYSIIHANHILFIMNHCPLTVQHLPRYQILLSLTLTRVAISRYPPDDFPPPPPRSRNLGKVCP